MKITHKLSARHSFQMNTNYKLKERTKKRLYDNKVIIKYIS